MTSPVAPPRLAAGRAVLYCGDALAVLGTLASETIDAVVTDPPYALTSGKKGGSGAASVNLDSPGGRARVTTGNGPGGFMGKAWDAVIPGPEIWAETLRVAKPGAHLLAFGGTRTFHRLTCAIEDAGWEIRDCLMWLYGSGFPKSHNLDGEWKGWGTALKPAWEPIILARKSLVGTVAANVAAHRTGALNVDGCRVDGPAGNGVWGSEPGQPSSAFVREYREPSQRHPAGRWPANVAIDMEAAAGLDAQSGDLVSGANPTRRGSNKFASTYGDFVGQTECTPARGVDAGGASRFFYCAKASRAEREAGLSGDTVLRGTSGGAAAAAARGEDYDNGDSGFNKTVRVRNHHPTVKPVALMRWLVRLVTPPRGLVLDPFAGSGTTGIACALEGFDFLGIEREAEYVEIARKRIAHAAAQPSLWDAA